MLHAVMPALAPDHQAPCTAPQRPSCRWVVMADGKLAMRWTCASPGGPAHAETPVALRIVLPGAAARSLAAA